MDTANQGAMFFMPSARIPNNVTISDPPPQLLVGHQSREVVTTAAGGFGTMRGQFVTSDPRCSVAPPTTTLYLCDSISEGGRETGEKVREKVSSMDLLQQCYHSLTNKKIKDNLSSFLPDVPGEFDTADTPDSMLRTLIDRPPIGGRDFLPLSEQSLLGFRLHPGALPEQYRLDPFSGDTRHYHNHKKKKKRKHKHKHIDREDSSTLDNYSPPSSHPHSPPVDPCSFIKAEQTANFFQQPQTEHHQSLPPSHHLPTHINPSQVTFPPTHSLVAGHPSMLASTPASVIISRGGAIPFMAPMMQLSTITNPQSLEQARLEKKRNKKRHQDTGEGGVTKKKKKKRDKDKKSKKEKHHIPLEAAIPQSVIGGGPPPLISSSYGAPLQPSLPQPPPRPPPHM